MGDRHLQVSILLWLATYLVVTYWDPVVFKP